MPNKNILPPFLLFISGAAALIYQTLWVKQLGLVVGVEVYAITTAISAFFAGLAVGGLVFGKKADGIQKPFQLVFILECAIAFTGLLVTLILFRAPELFVKTEQFAGPAAFAIPIILIFIPTFFMGGTLPALIRCTAPKQKIMGRAAGVLYAANTFGAIFGTLLVPFLLIPGLGLTGTAVVAASLNLLVALFAYAGFRKFSFDKVLSSVYAPWDNKGKLALTLYAMAGGVALGYEIVWSQAVAPFLSSRVYAFAIMLAVYLGGLVFGSYVFSRFADRSKRPWTIFGILISTAGLSAVLLLALAGPWIFDAQDSIGKFLFRLSESNMLANAGRFLSTGIILLFIPTSFLGAAFPAVARLIAGEETVGRDIGTISAVNTLGGIVGTFITGFVLIPWLGLIRSLGILVLVAVILGGIALLQEGKRSPKRYAVLSILFSLIGIFTLSIPENTVAALLQERRGGKMIFYDESAGGAVAVLEQDVPNGSFRRLYIQGVSNSGNSLASLRYMRLQALLPILIHNGEPSSALVLGFGTGITYGALAAYPPLEERVCVELLPGVIEAAPYFDENQGVWKDPAADIRINDGRHELLRSDQMYDMITLEPPPPTAAGVVNLYSTEFYELAKKRLNKHGILAQWWPLAAQNEEASKSLIKSFLDAFPYVSLWTTELHETLLVGSNDAISLDYDTIKTRFEQGSVREIFEPAGILSAEELIANYITDKDGLAAYVGDIEPVTDNRPNLEYAAWTRKGNFPTVLSSVASMATEIPLNTANPEVKAAVEDERQQLWTLYRAGYYLYERDEEQWEAMLKRIVPKLRTNPYYGSFVPER